MSGNRTVSPRGENAGKKTISPRGIELDNSQLLQTIYVSQSCFALCSPAVSGSRYLITDNLLGCIAIMAHYRERNLALLAHADSPEVASEALSMARQFEAKEITIYGGPASRFNRAMTLMISEGIRKNGLILAGQDIPVHQVPERTRAVGINGQTGEVFIPKNNCDFELYYGSMDIKHSLTYESPIPIEAFLERIRRK